MAKPLKWLTAPIRRRREQRQEENVKKMYSEITSEAAGIAADRMTLKADYGSIIEQVADLAQERQEIKESKIEIGTQVAEVFAERTTSRQTLFHLLKGNIGPGCLSLPWSFSQLGIFPGIAMTAFIGFWTYFNCMTLLKVKAGYTSNRRTITYSDLGEVAYGRRFRSIVTGSIVLLQLAVCTVYLSFVGGNLQAFFEAFVPELPTLGQTSAWSILLVLPVVVGITLIPTLKALGPVSEIAMIVLFAAFAVLGVVLVENYQGKDRPLPSINWVQAPIAVCGILYSFEGICIVLPLEASMQERTDFRTMFTWAYVGVTVLYCCIGALCVWVLGAVQGGSITAYLASHSDEYNGYVLVTISNLLASFAVLFTYALTMFPCIELWCQAKERKDRGDILEPLPEEEDWWGGELAYGPYDTPSLRLSLVAVTVILAVAIPDVTELIGLAGAVAGASTALILPPLLALHFAGPGFSVVKIREYALLILGIIFGVVGAVASLYDIYSTMIGVEGTKSTG